MDSHISPADIRRAEFRTSLRGLDRQEVMAFLASIADRIEELAAENQKLAEASGETTERDLEDEFERVGREVTAILQTAREAADAMRERASLDAARWRTEAMEEAETNRREAAADAEALRRDAWTAGSELLAQVAAEAKSMREQVDRDVLTIQGEAEREAHRLTSGARREAEDLVRNARMDADKTTSDAAKRRDQIIDQANRQAAAAQERTRALEQRRDELMEELESVRSTLSRLEGSLEERRESLELSAQESTTVRVVPTSRPQEDPEHWEPGETVRVVRSDDDEPEHIVDIDLPDQDIEPMPSIEPVQPTRPAVEIVDPGRGDAPRPERKQPQPKVRPQQEMAAKVRPSAEPRAEDEQHDPQPEAPEEGSGDDVGALFQSLRTGTDAAEEQDGADREPDRDKPDAEEPVTESEPASRDWIEVRDAKLLPITNRALRGAKKSLTELQNIALDGLRTEEQWAPDEEVIGEALQAELIAVWAESFAAGHSVAEEMTDSKIKRPPTPQADSVAMFASALARSVQDALEAADDGQRAQQAAASRVFRVWRTDEAERRIRELAIRAYELGVEHSVGVDSPVG